MSKKKKICNVFIIDASASMTSKADEVRGELRKQFKQLRKEKDFRNRVYVVDFSGNGDYRILAENIKPKSLKKELSENYHPRGMTALYDAIGKTFKLIKNDDYDGVFVSILTDGMENSSTEFTLDQIKELIHEKRTKEKWGIVFSGTTEEALSQAKAMGIAATNMTMYADTAQGLADSAELRRKSAKLYKSAVITATNKEDIDPDNLMTNEEGT